MTTGVKVLSSTCLHLYSSQSLTGAQAHRPEARLIDVLGSVILIKQLVCVCVYVVVCLFEHQLALQRVFCFPLYLILLHSSAFGRSLID